MKQLKSRREIQVPLANEALFRRLLGLERRRCERSGNRFALLLIDLEALQRTLSSSAIGEIADSVAGAMRETDVTGWYEDSRAIGVILTAVNETGRDTIESIVVERARHVLEAHLDAKQMQHVQISIHVFPEDEFSNEIFYSHEHRARPKGRFPGFIKRAVDVSGSLAALIVLSPVFLVIAVLIKLTSGGPVFLRQKRIGRYGREFTFLQFRSMYVENYPRVTPIGPFLRKTSLDEIPQFINVLKGEMSLVGPRPPIPCEFETYALWHRRRILEAKPGITGDWQVHGRSRTTFDDMVRMDLRYIRNQSTWLDLKILLKTPLAVISGNGESSLPD